MDSLPNGGQHQELGLQSPDRLLRAFADEDVRQLFFRTETAKTVPQLVAELDIPRSTAYRKIEELEDTGLVVPATEKNVDGRSPTEYRRVVDEIRIRIRNEMTIEYLVFLDEQVIGADGSQ